jgi:hypothetical protein
MTDEKKFSKEDVTEIIDNMVESGVLNTNGKWINNKVPLWKNIVKPCKLCGFCPYGQLVEEYPLPPMTRAEEIDWIENLKKQQVIGAYDEENKVDGKPTMTREEAQKYIDEFDPEDYPKEKDERMEKMSCTVFGHCCPVFFQMELFTEDEKVTEEEMNLCEKEIEEWLDRMEREMKKDKKKKGKN